MIRGHNDAETCRLNGWTVGTRLVGDEGNGPTVVIEITAIGREGLLAIEISHRGLSSARARETTWSLSCRDWQVVPA